MSASTIAPTPFFSASACLLRKSFCASIRAWAAPNAAAAVLAVSISVSTASGRRGADDQRRAERLEVRGRRR